MLIGGWPVDMLPQPEDDGSGFGDAGDGVRVPGRIPTNVQPLMSDVPAGLPHSSLTPALQPSK